MNMRTKNLMRIVVMVSLAALLVLSGCSGNRNDGANGGGESADNNGDGGGGQNQGDGGTKDSGGTNGKKYGGTLRLAMNSPSANLGNVVQSRTVQEVLMAAPALETLGRYDPQGNIVPWLAESWDPDPNALTITYHLRSGVKFHDGTDFNADAVKWNLEQMISAGRSEFVDIDAVEVVDDKTVRIRLKHWNSSMVESIANFLWIISPAAYEKNGKDWAAKNPVGTGPFVIDSFEQDVVIKYKKFDGYWQEGKPYLDAIEWHMIADPLIAAASFRNKDIDGYLGVPADTAKELAGVGNLVKLQSGLGAVGLGWITDSGDPNSPFADARVRKALGHAINVEELVSALSGDFSIVTNQWGVSTVWSYNPQVQGTPYDPEKAKQLLAEAGYGNGLKTTLTAVQNNEQWATATQGYLKAVGIDAEIQIVDDAKFREMTGNKGSWDGIMQYNFRGDGDVALYMPRNFGVNGPLYAPNVAKPDDVQQLLEEVKRAPDQETKTKIAHELQRLVFEEYALAKPLFISTSPAVLHHEVKDTGINETYMTMYRPEDAWLDR
jgi:ABC-type dipeptide transport system, periplasmic component